MATTTATLSIASNDLIPSMPLNINASSTLAETGLTTGLELMDMGYGKLTEDSADDQLFKSLGTANSANYVYICNNSTDINHYMTITIGAVLIGSLGSGEWLFMPWNCSDAAAEIEVQAEPSGTIEYEYAIFKSAWTLPSAGS